MNSEELMKIISDSSKKADLSGVVYIKQGEEVLSASAFGYANRSEERPNHVDTRFGIASGSKLFTAIGICQLAERGQLSFDTPLKDCLDLEFPYFDEGVTIHQLLTHTSGIPDYFDEEVMDDFEDLWKDNPVYQMKRLDDFLPLFHENEMKFTPGERFHYNNAGYILLGLVIEQLTGKCFREYIEENIFRKAGMEHSGYFSMDRLPGNTAMGYIDNHKDHAWRTNIYSVPIKGGPDGGAFTTAPDMARLWEALFGHRLLSEDTTNKLLAPHVKVNDTIHYGYGIWMNKKNDHIYKYHVMGYDPGVRFRSSFYPQLDLKLVIPANNESEPLDVTKAIEDYFFTEKETC
ncbi:serine hydrolase [Bacillus sp. REN3]|uniref:serine hydrolase domain-containing protein n=1 Tax=Bacillus sp. REN3 TaxID=2802440 RepID=UPI001AEDE6C5|nr:serine hydrolase [Bacillus sp. REN3]